VHLSLQTSADYLSLLGVTNFVQIPRVSKNTPDARFSPEIGYQSEKAGRKRARTEGTPNSFACKHASLGVACGGHAVLALSLGPVQLIVCLLDEVLQARHVFG
jgi:hypothetical protein